MLKKNKKPRPINDYEEIQLRLHEAWEELKKHPHKDTKGLDGETINTYSSKYSLRIKDLTRKLSEDKFSFHELRRVTIQKDREILIQNIEERIVSQAILLTVEKYLKPLNSNVDFSRKLIELPNGETPPFDGIPLAVKIIQKYFSEGYIWVFEADLKKFFDNVPKKNVLDMVSVHIKDKKVLELIRQLINFKPERSTRAGAKTYDPRKGLAQGLPMSPILASIYLYEFDTFITKNFSNVKLVRYVDDFIILCKTEKVAKEMYAIALNKLKEMELPMYELGEVHKTSGKQKTKITCAKGGAFNFIGFQFNYMDIDIVDDKKKEMEKKIKEILYGGGSFFSKTRSIESRLKGYIEHYKWKHYSKTMRYIVKIIKISQIELRKYYIDTYIKITKREPFNGLSEETVNSLFNFMGINFESIVDYALAPDTRSYDCSFFDKDKNRPLKFYK